MEQHAFFEGKIVPFGEAKVSIAIHGLNYGTAAFGGLRAYWNAEQGKLFIFRPLEHYRRFLNSAKILCMELPHTPESLTQVTIDLAGQTLQLPDGRKVNFPIDNFSKTCILNGLDQLGYLQSHAAAIAAFEEFHPDRVNTLAG